MSATTKNQLAVYYSSTNEKKKFFKTKLFIAYL